MNLGEQYPRWTNSHYLGLHVSRCNSRRAQHKDAWYEKVDVYFKHKDGENLVF